MSGTHPPDIGVLISTHCPAEGPTTFLTFNQRRKEIFVALTLVFHIERRMPRMKSFPCLFKGLIINDPQFRPLHNHPFRLIFICSLSSQEIRHFLLSIDDFSCINLIGENPTNCILAPLTITLCGQSFFIQHIGNLCSTIAFFRVPLVNLANHFRFFLINSQIEVIANGLIISVHNVGNPSLFCIHFLTEFHTLGSVGTFLLGKSTENSQNKFTVSHTGHVGCEELSFDT